MTDAQGRLWRRDVQKVTAIPRFSAHGRWSAVDLLDDVARSDTGCGRRTIRIHDGDDVFGIERGETKRTWRSAVARRGWNHRRVAILQLFEHASNGRIRVGRRVCVFR